MTQIIFADCLLIKLVTNPTTSKALKDYEKLLLSKLLLPESRFIRYTLMFSLCYCQVGNCLLAWHTKKLAQKLKASHRALVIAWQSYELHIGLPSAAFDLVFYNKICQYFLFFCDF